MLVRPLRAIRYKCMDCSNWQWSEVRDCPHADCILWPLRFGKKPKGQKYEKRTIEEYHKSIEGRG